MAFQDDVNAVRERLQRELNPHGPRADDDDLLEALLALARIEKSRELHASFSVPLPTKPLVDADELLAMLKPKVNQMCAEAWDDGYKWGYDGDTDAKNPFRAPLPG